MTTSSTNQLTNQTGGLRGLQEMDIGFRFKFLVAAKVSTVLVACVVG